MMKSPWKYLSIPDFRSPAQIKLEIQNEAELMLYSFKFRTLFLFIMNVSIKLLLVEFYHSTDLEVHRNWMAITYNLPMSQWYKEATSEWTLDYPPYFAYFEYVLSYFAQYFDDDILKISAEPIMNPSIKLFMRLSVIVTDFFYFYSIYRCLEFVPAKFRTLILFLSIFNLGLIFVDSIHFQYNGFMFGILILSIIQAYEGHYYWSAFSFAVLLNFKHIFVYYAPAFGLYFLCQHCFRDRQTSNPNFKNISIFTTIVLIVFCSSLGPFIHNGTFLNLLQRLFPFGRGLTHAYWAPNFWAVYNFVDLFLAKLFLFQSHESSVSTSSGLVKQIDMKILPNISAPFTIFLILSLFFIYLSLRQGKGISALKKDDNIRRLPRIELVPALIISSYLFFLFGYHVHEKAILMILCPLTLGLLRNGTYIKSFIFLTFSGYFSLFPLLFHWNEIVLKWAFMLNFTVFFLIFMLRYFPEFRLKSWENLYFGLLCFSGLVESFGIFVFPTFFHRFPFLPLMVHSVVCFIGVFYSFLLLFFIY